ncbi:MAG: LamG domain-containing protein, partial [Bacteroidales bacterium]|nr:LamG domain-containing protein [Bacteroidales bacterium]
VWDTTWYPSVDSYLGITNDGSGLGSFTSYLTNLHSNLTYYVRAYATNSLGTTYGENKIFIAYHSPPGNALDFDGIDDYVTIPDHSSLDISGTITIEAWLNFTDFEEGAGIVCKGNGFGGEVYCIDYTGGNIRFFFWAGGIAYQCCGSLLSTNGWHHIVGQYDGSNVITYIDGIKTTGDAYAGSLGTNDHEVSIGSRQSGSGAYDLNFCGKIDEIRIWNIARTEQEIRENMHLSFTGLETGLVGYWLMDEDGWTTAGDFVNGNNGTLNNMNDEDWMESSIPSGFGYSHQQIVSTTGNVIFDNTELAMDFTTKTGTDTIVATKINRDPNIIPAGPEDVFDSWYWVVNKYGTGTFNANLIFTIAEDLTIADQNNPSNISLYTRGSNADTNWMFLASASSVEAANDQATFDGITSFSQFIIAREIEQTGITLNLIAYLEGPFNGTNMNTLVNSNGFLPLAQSYNQAPWNYTGTEAVTSIPNTDVVDWILVELRDTTEASLATSETMIAQQAAFILNDGSVAGMDGIENTCIFSTTITSNLFVVLWHRNSIGIMSAYPLVETGGIYTYDFTTGANQVYGGGNAHKEIASGVWGMTGGDGNADGQINNGDKIDVWSIQAGSGGYLSGDFNLDSQVNNGDKNDVWIPNTGLGGQVPDGSTIQCHVPQ